MVCGPRAPAKALLDWSRLGVVLGAAPQRDVVVIDRGIAALLPAPRCESDAREMLALGQSVVVRAAERHDDALAELAGSFRAALGGAVHIQLFATPIGQRTFRWHYDAEEVFVLQTAGVKDYWVRRNTVDPRPSMVDWPDYDRIELETSRRECHRLRAGDWLYIPSPWWHVGQCIEESLSVSVGVFA